MHSPIYNYFSSEEKNAKHRHGVAQSRTGWHTSNWSECNVVIYKLSEGHQQVSEIVGRPVHVPMDVQWHNPRRRKWFSGLWHSRNWDTWKRVKIESILLIGHYIKTSLNSVWGNLFGTDCIQMCFFSIPFYGLWM